jgi:hypothetical protein
MVRSLTLLFNCCYFSLRILFFCLFSSLSVDFEITFVILVTLKNEIELNSYTWAKNTQRNYKDNLEETNLKLYNTLIILKILLFVVLQ